MAGAKWKEVHLAHWQRLLLVGLLTALCSQLYFTAWAEGFRISTAVILYPILLITFMRESHRPDTGLVTCLCVLILRVLLDLVQGASFSAAFLREYPGGLFYLFYDALLCFLVRDRRSVSQARLWSSLLVCDFAANLLNLALSSRLGSLREPLELTWLGGLALVRSTVAWAILLLSWYYRRLLVRQEHEERYRRLFLMTAELKNELYFLKKNAEDIESVMSSAYRLYEELPEEDGELKSLALSVARDVHEVKKDNLRIIRGLEDVVTEAYDDKAMLLSDLLHILTNSTRQLLGRQRADIRLECRFEEDMPIQEHYQLLSVLKNLVTNAVEAIQADSGRGTVQVICRKKEESLCLEVRDDGPGITERGMKHLFQVGYSTKFDPGTGNINRGVGLTAVQHIVESLGGSMEVASKVGQGTCFFVTLPLADLMGGKA